MSCSMLKESAEPDTTHDIANEIGAAEWVHGPIDRNKQDSAQFLTFQWATIKDMLRQIYQDFKMYTTDVKMEPITWMPP